jgi:hypothetical protein
MYLAGAPRNLWSEAISYAAYVRNRTPHGSLQMQIPALLLKILTGQTERRRLYDHIHIWGCAAWMHNSETGKLDPKATKCVFMGVDTVKKGYRLLRVDNRTVCISRNVVFDETDFPMRASNRAAEQNARAGATIQEIQPTTAAPTVATVVRSSSSLDPAAEGQSPVSLRNNPLPSSQALRNIVGDSAEVAVTEPPHSTRKPRTGSCKDDVPELVSDSDSDTDDDDDFNCDPPDVANIAKKFHRKPAVNADPDEPSTRKKMLQSTLNKEWVDAEIVELRALKEHGTWVEVPQSQAANRKVLTSKWVYKIKRNADHSVERYKARLTARGFQQIEGQDYFDTFAPVAQLKSFRILMALSVLLGLTVTHVDISNAFLNAPLEETIYMHHPEGYPGTPGTVLLLKKALYGVKQAPRMWGKTLLQVFLDLGFSQNGAEPCLLFHLAWKCYICTFSDDLGIATANEAARTRVMSALTAKFKLRDLGLLVRYLGIEVARKDGKVFLHQKSYVETVVTKFGMTECKPVPTPAAAPATLTKQQCPTTDDEKAETAKLPYKSLVGSLWYAAHGTRPDIVYATNSVAQYAQNPGMVHWQAAKRVVRYLQDKANMGLTYSPGHPVRVTAYSDSDWANDVDTRRSKTAYVVTVAGGPVVWQTKSQKSIALSSCEAELYALAEALKEILWIRHLLTEMQIPFDVPKLWVDNQGAIALAKNPIHHQRSKHIAVRWFFVRDAIDKGLVDVSYVETNENRADIGTKATVAVVHQRHTDTLMPKFPKFD